MGALWDEHDKRAFMRRAGVRSRLSRGDYRLNLCGASALCDAARCGCSLRTARLVWASGVSISRAGIQRRFPAKSPGPSTRLTEAAGARGLYPPLP